MQLIISNNQKLTYWKMTFPNLTAGSSSTQFSQPTALQRDTRLTRRFLYSMLRVCLWHVLSHPMLVFFVWTPHCYIEALMVHAHLLINSHVLITEGTWSQSSNLPHSSIESLNLLLKHWTKEVNILTDRHLGDHVFSLHTIIIKVYVCLFSTIPISQISLIVFTPVLIPFRPCSILEQIPWY